MFLIGLGALLVLGGIVYMARAAIWRGPLPAGSRHSGAATARRAILGARNELAGHSPYVMAIGAILLVSGARF